jgi:hypothetical protein
MQQTLGSNGQVRVKYKEEALNKKKKEIYKQEKTYLKCEAKWVLEATFRHPTAKGGLASFKPQL